MAGEGDPADSRKLDSGDGQWPGGLRSWVGLALFFPERLLPRLFKCQVCCGDQAVGGALLQILGPASCKWAKARVQGALGLGPGSGCVAGVCVSQNPTGAAGSSCAGNRELASGAWETAGV